MIKNITFCSTFILIVLSFTACNSDDGPNSIEDTELTSTNACIYSITIGSEQIDEDGSDGEPLCGVTSSTSSDNIGFYKIPGAYLADANTRFGLHVSKGKIRTSNFITTPTNEEFEDHFAIGNYSFSKEALDGFEIYYQTQSGEIWSSSRGSAEQSSSSITISEVVNGQILNSFYVNIKATYNCILYNDSGESRNSSGTFILQFENF